MSIFSHQLRSDRRAFTRGFTIVELLMVVVIVVIITSLILVRQSQFNSSTLLRSLSYSVALSMRQAQIYGTTVFGVITAPGNCIGGTYDTSSGNCFASGYGVTFSSGDATSYSLFGDLNNSGVYDAGDQIIRTFTLGGGYSLSRFCAGKIVGGVQDCWPTAGTGGANITQLSILFKRPNSDACFATDTSPTTCSSSGTLLYASSSVQITGGGGSTRTIVVSSTGQISVCQANTSC